jgi:hypothetical protein
VIGQVIFLNDQVGRGLPWRVAARMRLDGSFVFDALPRGDLQVIAVCPGAIATSGEAPAFATPAEVAIGATGDLCRPQVFKLTDETNRIVVKMEPTAECRVRVIGPEGAPLAGVRCAFSPNVRWWRWANEIYCREFYGTIDLLQDSKIERRMRSDPIFSAVTDADGAALIRDLPPKLLRLSVMHDDFELPGGGNVDAQPAVQLTAGEQAHVQVRLQARK